MRRSDLLVAGAVGIFAGFVALQVSAAPPRAAAATRESAARVDSAAVARYYYENLRPSAASLAPPRWLSDVHVARLCAAAGRAARTRASGGAPRDDAAIRAVLDAGERDSYVGAILAANDSVLARWPAAASPVRVWVQPRSAAAGFTPSLVSPVRASFLTWNDLALPVSFALVDDSTQADIHVTWADNLPGLGQIGNTLRITDGDGWIVAAHVVLHTGYDIATVQNASLHEVGHALGLDHSPNSQDLMAASTDGRQYRLTPADRNTARLLYSVPPGRVR